VVSVTGPYGRILGYIIKYFVDCCEKEGIIYSLMVLIVVSLIVRSEQSVIYKAPCYVMPLLPLCFGCGYICSTGGVAFPGGRVS
jgi:hypothetical protein